VDVHHLLLEATTIAIVGCSANAYRASNQAAGMLTDNGYVVVPVNPKYSLVNGIRCYSDFSAIPDDLEIDIVNIFRNSAYTASVVEAIAERVTRTGRKPVVWTQLGVSSPKAEQMAERANLDYIVNRCIMVELSALGRNR
jgi:predicted CoA-binding protein